MSRGLIVIDPPPGRNASPKTMAGIILNFPSIPGAMQSLSGCIARPGQAFVSSGNDRCQFAWTHFRSSRGHSVCNRSTGRGKRANPFTMQSLLKILACFGVAVHPQLLGRQSPPRSSGFPEIGMRLALPYRRGHHRRCSPSNMRRAQLGRCPKPPFDAAW